MAEEKLYHYSPITGKAEVCHASSMSTCPYRSYFHSTDIEQVQQYADKENEQLSKMPEWHRDFFTLNSDNESSYRNGLSTYASTKLTKEDLEYLGFSKSDIDYILSHEKVDVIQDTAWAKQYYFNNPDRCNLLFQQLNNAYNEGFFGTDGNPYDKWALTPYIDHARKNETIQIYKDVVLKGPKRWGYSLNDCWNDFLDYKIKTMKGYKVEKGNMNYFVICY